MQRPNLKTVAVNVAVTFVEGFLAYWAVTGNVIDKTVLVGAAAAGASLAWNTVIKPILKDKGVL